ncbi:tRNA (adenosine(37)-N6)-threonylcarbamoyltransferase complex ATPase subunit type 1 TsaE [Candidatus Methylocalor cossyra]|uniref:tRNA threonylcarbamoyladenosine biosynthesis protein TsaE n=1 Tax=Candidatus Methylocalor cossyra TaxID=3108543 RepID=A0ABP1C569_9GAMM
MIVALPDEAATLALARRVYACLPRACLVFLRGNLGAGKTAFVRGCLRAAGFEGPVKSPTFTLVEEYPLADRILFHFDLYRLNTAEDLEWLGFRDYLRADALCLVEWPERGAGKLPAADLEIRLTIEDGGRRAELSAATETGRGILARLTSGA